jgi:hypothetical protein
MASNDRKIDSEETRKDLERSGRGVLQVLYGYTWSSTYDLCDLRPAALTTTKSNKLIITQDVLLRTPIT